MEDIELVNSGDHPALDFLNTTCRPWGEQIELLASGKTFLDWLVSVDLLGGRERTSLARTFTVTELDQVAARGRDLREWLRTEVESWGLGGSAALSSTSRTKLNRVMALDNQYMRLEPADDGGLRSVHRWERAEQLLALPAVAAAELFAHGDVSLVRRCDGPRCGLWFYDRTKSHRRRWCSQAVCGNRDKVKNHRARVAAAG